jgi:ribosomal protein S27E
VVQEHPETFLAAARTDGIGLPHFIEREFRGFLRCGVLAHGFLRVRCDDCAFERLVPLSCKGRAVCASCGGAVAANNRDGLEQLARYVLRLPIAQERLTRTADGRVLPALKAEWSDGTTHLWFEPIELLERLAALTPRPRINLVLHHGALASHSRWRARAVAYGRDTLGSVSPDAGVGCGTAAPPVPPNAPWSAGELEPSGAWHGDPVVTLGGHPSEPWSSTR